MAAYKNVRPPVPHQCPVCGCPQTKIQRILGEEKYGSTCWVRSRAACSVGRDLSKIDTWVAV